MKEKTPLVSIIVRTKDRPKLLNKALQSIALQTYRPIEVVLVNDGGCDLPEDELKEILGDVSLNYICLKENRGRAGAGNVGIKNAKGEYIGFLDDDDEFYPEHVETLVSVLETKQNYQVAYTDAFYIFQEWGTDKYVTVNEKVLYSQDFDRQSLFISNYIPLLNVMYKKDLGDKEILLFDEQLDAHEDWDLWLQLSQYSNFLHINKVTAEVSVRTDGTTMTSANRMAFLKSARTIHKKYSKFITDERAIERQYIFEWLLAKEVVNRSEVLVNSEVIDVADALIRHKNIIAGNLETAIHEKTAYADHLENTIKDKDAYTDHLENTIKDKDAYTDHLEKTIKDKDAILHRIYSSHIWKTLLVYYKLEDRLFHPHSKRRKAVKCILYCPRNVINACMEGVTRLLVFAGPSKVIRSCYASVNAMSNRFVRPLFPALHDKVFVDFKLYLKHRSLVRVGQSDNITLLQTYSLHKLKQKKYYPKVSVIVPNYNHARYLRQRLESIYQQTYKNIEVILLDDGSTDESVQILDAYRQCYPDITRCFFNNGNSGGVFSQWTRGITLAQGELIWIAESDDYCSENLIEELVAFFANEAMMVAFCKTVFTDGDSSQQTWSLEEYLADVIDADVWTKPFIKSAHYLVNTIWGIKNIIPNVSSMVFRNAERRELMEDEEWMQMKICGDWIFYLHIIRGGLVGFTPNATNFFRMHKKNTSVSTYKQDIYYREHEKVAEALLLLYDVKGGMIEKQQHVLEMHWKTHRSDYSDSNFRRCYDYDRVKNVTKERRPNLMMIIYALISGGGETFPIRLCNLLKQAGFSVTLLNCQREPTENGIRRMLRQDIPLLELDTLDELSTVVDDMGIEVVHSHHAWVDVTICSLLKDNPHCKVVVTTHGMYDMMSHAELNRVAPILSKRVNKFIYVADKNLNALTRRINDHDNFVKISNAFEQVPITPIPREELGVDEEAFVLSIVSRAIPEKGWREGISAVKLARNLSGKDIHLLLIGDGPEYEKLRKKYRDSFIRFLGFKANVRDYFAASNVGFLPSRFRGESYPLSVIECLQAYRPIIASDIGETAKMLETESGLAGSVFPLDDWSIPIDQVAELIAEYAMNDDLYAEHLRRAPLAAKKFDAKKMLHDYEAVYHDVM